MSGEEEEEVNHEGGQGEQSSTNWKCSILGNVLSGVVIRRQGGNSITGEGEGKVGVENTRVLVDESRSSSQRTT